MGLIRAIVCLVGLALCAAAAADLETVGESRFRIGSGGGTGTYYPISNLIARAIGEAGRRADDAFVLPNVLALAQRSNGSVSNVREIDEGLLEAGLSQADVAYWAYRGSGPFADDGGLQLRAVATLYLESLHLIARRGSGIRSVADLKGQRVSLDEGGSGTLFGVRSIVRAFGLSPSDLKAVYLKPEDAIERFYSDQLDAFFILAGFPVRAVSDLVARAGAVVVPVAGTAVDQLLQQTPLWTRDLIPAGVYGNAEPIETIGVGAQLIVRADLDDDLVYRVTGILWSAPAQRLLAAGHPKGGQIRLHSAIDRLAIPLHPGAERFYREAGVLDLSAPSPPSAAR